MPSPHQLLWHYNVSYVSHIESCYYTHIYNNRILLEKDVGSLVFCEILDNDCLAFEEVNSLYIII